jgi:hypothetical protein
MFNIDQVYGEVDLTNPNAYAAVESLRIDYGDLGPFGVRS